MKQQSAQKKTEKHSSDFFLKLTLLTLFKLSDTFHKKENTL